MLLNGSPLDGAPLDGEEAVFGRLRTSSLSDTLTTTDSGRTLYWELTVEAQLEILEQLIRVSSGVTTKIVGDSVLVTDGFTRVVLRTSQLSDALTIADTSILSRLRNITTQENVTLLDQLMRYAFRGRVMNDLIIASDTLTREMRLTRSSAEVIVTQDSHAGVRVKTGLMTDTLTVSDIGRLLTWEILTEGGITVIDQTIAASANGVIVTRIASDAVLVTDGSFKAILRNRTLLEALSVADSVNGRDVIHTVDILEDISAQDSYLLRRLRTLVSPEGITLVDFMLSSASSVRTITTTDSIVVFDQTVRSVQRTRFTSDAISANEQLAKTLERIRSTLDGVFFEDGQLKVRQYSSVLGEFVVLTDEAAKQIIQAVLYDVRIIIGVGMEPVLGVHRPIVLGAYH